MRLAPASRWPCCRFETPPATSRSIRWIEPERGAAHRAGAVLACSDDSLGRVHQVLQDLRIQPNATLSPAELERVADFTSARSVFWGQFTRFGNAIRIDATLQDLDQADVPLNAMAPNEGALLTASQLAGAVRESLARVRGHSQRAEVDRLEALDELLRCAPALQRGPR